MLILEEVPKQPRLRMTSPVERLRMPGPVCENRFRAKNSPPKENFASEALVEHSTQE
jgi:hypothetical protein